MPSSAGYMLTANDIGELRRWIAWCRKFKITGPNVRGINSPSMGAAYHIGAPRTHTSHDDDSSVAIRIDIARTARGWYRAYVLVRPSGPINTATDPGDVSTGGTDGTEVSAWNRQEAIIGTGHDLTLPGNPSQRLFGGHYTGQVDEEGRPVVHFNGVYVGCT